MKEIKFRAWDTINESMMRVFDLEWFKNYSDSPSEWKENTECRFSENCIFMQYTGLKDVNGVEAYEGDIYNCGYEYSDGKHKYGDYNIIEDIRDFDPEDSFEIIGNIFENQELNFKS